jgi:hypothetical protein
VDPTDDPRVSPEERRRLFLDTAEKGLRNGRNIVICPEGTSTETEGSPLPFKTGAFHLATSVRPEPLVVPIAVANFDKKLTRTTTVAVVHEPIRLSEHLGENIEKEALREFVNERIYGLFESTSAKPCGWRPNLQERMAPGCLRDASSRTSQGRTGRDGAPTDPTSFAGYAHRISRRSGRRLRSSSGASRPRSPASRSSR